MVANAFSTSHMGKSIMFSSAAFEPKAPSTIRCGSAVPAEWQQKHFEAFLPRDNIKSGALGDPAVSSLLPLPGQVRRVLSEHFSQQPSLVKATHPRDQLDWTATVLHQCLLVTSEHTSSVPSACSSRRSFISVTRLTQWHLLCSEPMGTLMARIR